MTTHTYLINSKQPWLKTEVFLSVLHTTKSGATWATPLRLNGRRFKVGATAFLTMEAAERRRLGLCARALQPDQVRLMDRLGFASATAAARRAQPPMIYQGQTLR